jgi:outer membrane immunogenic protein
MKIKQIIRMGAAAIGALAIASAAPAGAADLYRGGNGSLKDVPYIPPPLWTGFYIGGHVGGAWSDNNNNDNLGFFTFPDESTGIFSRNNNNNQSAVFGGVQFGYNWQNFGNGFFGNGGGGGLFGPNWMLGFEVDFGGFGQTNNNRRFTAVSSTGEVVTIGNLNCAGSVLGSCSNNDNNQSGLYGDVTGRIGYTWNNVLLYGKGGFAWLTNPTLNMVEAVTTPDGTTTIRGVDGISQDNILPGWTAGGGIEYLFSQNWSVKVEYLHFDFSQGSERCCNDGILNGSGIAMNDFRLNRDLTFETVKVGINYIFNQPPPLPLK